MAKSCCKIVRPLSFERLPPWTLVAIAIAGLTAGSLARAAARPDLADIAWAIGTAPVIGGLAVRDLLGSRLGVDAIAILSMSAALALGQASGRRYRETLADE